MKDAADIPQQYTILKSSARGCSGPCLTLNLHDPPAWYTASVPTLAVIQTSRSAITGLQEAAGRLLGGGLSVVDK